MEYERAKEIYIDCDCDYDVMRELGFLEEFSSYKVPFELKQQWMREETDRRIDELKEYGSGQDVEYSHHLSIIQVYARRFTREQTIRLYETIIRTNRVMPLSTQLYSYCKFYEVFYYQKNKEDTEMTGILKDIVRRYEAAFEENGDLRQEHQKEHDFFQKEVEKYSSNL